MLNWNYLLRVLFIFFFLKLGHIFTNLECISIYHFYQAGFIRLSLACNLDTHDVVMDIQNLLFLVLLISKLDHLGVLPF